MRQLRVALGFLTPLPVGTPVPDGQTLGWFPPVGALLGLLVGAGWWLATEAFDPLLAAGLVVVLDVAVTGALHLDGIADSADGLLAHDAGTERRLAIMRAPDVGAYGVVALVVVLGLRWSAWASMPVDVVLVGALWAAGRAVMALALVAVPYVGGGLGAAFVGGKRAPVAVCGVVVPVTLAGLSADPAVALGAIVAAAVAGAAVVGLGRRRLGGITGDVLGAAGVVAETAGLLVVAARW